MSLDRSESERVWAPLPGRRRWLAALAGTVLLAGVATPFLGVGDVSAALLAAGGLAALFVSLWAAVERIRMDATVRRPSAVETRDGVRRAGAPFETTVRNATSDQPGERMQARATVRSRLSSLASSVLSENGDEGAARDALATGTWTDDPVAASMLRDGTDGEINTHEGNRWGGMLGRGPSYADRVARTVDALAAVELDDVVADREWVSDPDPGAASGRWESGPGLTGRWRGIGALGLLTLAVAVFAGEPGLVLGAATLFGLAGYARLLRPPEPDLRVERSFDADEPGPDERVTVTVTVTNAGDRLLADLRVVDAVPPHLVVVDGSPRHATALRPGESATFEYEVLTVFGEHHFGQAHVAVADPSGQRLRTATLDTEVATLSCEPRDVQESVPLHPQATGVTGRVSSDVGGSGTEFYSVREYRRGDPLKRIDWNRAARSGEFATLEFREEHAATVVVLVDARLSAFRAPDRDALSAVHRSLAGAAQVFASLQRDGDTVGLGSVGPEVTWVGPGAGADHRSRVRSTLQHDPAFAPREWDEEFVVDDYLREIRRRLPSDAQLVVFSPLLDDSVETVVRRLAAHGHQVTVFSPDPTTLDSVGAIVAHLERRQHLATLRAAGVRVVDWPADEPLEVAVDRAQRRWKT